MSNLIAEGVNVSLKGRNILKNITMTVQPGEVVLVSGCNGCGKTTLIKTLAGLIRPKSGDIEICGMHYGEKGIYKHVGYAPWRFGVYDSVKVFEYLVYYAAAGRLTGLMARKRIEHLLDVFEMTDRADDDVTELSAGMLQRLNIIRCILHNPEVLLFDEPLNCLDTAGRSLFSRCVKEDAQRGKSIVISSHNLTQMENICTSVCFMKQGEIVFRNSLDHMLRENAGKSMVKIVLADSGQLQDAIRVLRPLDVVRTLSSRNNEILVNLKDSEGAFEDMLNIFLQHNIATLTFARENRTLEDIFNDYFEV
ncbi:MAG: ABC transporter ATP-binding protein [Lachnospiraceae bacterium]|nr:ABC transporter ATP-binding protein [Lachnospiraceae bacterium]